MLVNVWSVNKQSNFLAHLRWVWIPPPELGQDMTYMTTRGMAWMSQDSEPRPR